MGEGEELTLARYQRLPGGDRIWHRAGRSAGRLTVWQWLVGGKVVFTRLGYSAGFRAVPARDSGTAFLPRTLMGPATGTFCKYQSLAFRTLQTSLAGSLPLLLGGDFRLGVRRNKYTLGGSTPGFSAYSDPSSPT